MWGGHTGQGPNTSYRGPFMRSCRPTMCAEIFMTAASREKEPRHVVLSALRPSTTSLISQVLSDADPSYFYKRARQA